MYPPPRASQSRGRGGSSYPCSRGAVRTTSAFSLALALVDDRKHWAPVPVNRMPVLRPDEGDTVAASHPNTSRQKLAPGLTTMFLDVIPQSVRAFRRATKCPPAGLGLGASTTREWRQRKPFVGLDDRDADAWCQPMPFSEWPGNDQLSLGGHRCRCHAVILLQQ